MFRSGMALLTRLGRPAVWLVGVLAIGLNWAPAAGSQEEDPPGDVARSTPSVEQITVTARKREEDLQRTPLSLTAITRDQLESGRLPDLTSIEALTPNLSFSIGTDGGSSSVNAFVRGVGQGDHVITTDPGVGVYLDGVYLSRVYGANLELADIEQITVLRGPQGTLFGKNTIGGAINIVTRKPSGDLHYSIKGTVGSYGYQGVNAYLEMPLVPEELSASFSILRKDSDGWQKRPGHDSGDDDLWAGRAQLYWTPNEAFSSQLIIDKVHQRQVGYPQVLLEFNPGAQPFAALYNGFVAQCCTPNTSIDRSNVGVDSERDDLDNFGVNWTNTWEIGEMTLKSISAYRTMDTEIVRDSDNSPLDYFHVPTEIDHTQFSQELLLSGSSIENRLDWLVGAYYSDDDSEHLTPLTVAGGLSTALSHVPPLAHLAVPLDLTSNYDREQATESLAFFAHTSYSLTDNLRLILAGRYTQEEKDYTLAGIKRESQTPLIAPGPTSPSSCSDVTLQGIESTFNCKKDWAEFSPKAGFDYQWTDDLMTYAHISRGFRSGQFNGRPIMTNEVSDADPETLTSYELGMKSQWFDDRLRLNMALFLSKYKDQQVLVALSTPLGLVLTTDNAARSTLKGFEIEATALPLPNLSLNAGLSYVDPEYDKYNTIDSATQQTVDISDRPFAYTPEWNASLSAQYSFPIGDRGELNLVGSISYFDDVRFTNDTTNVYFDQLHSDEYTLVNAGILYTTPGEQWEFALHGRNLTDKRELKGGFGVGAFGHVEGLFTPPRRVFFSVQYRH